MRKLLYLRVDTRETTENHDLACKWFNQHITIYLLDKATGEYLTEWDW